MTTSTHHPDPNTPTGEHIVSKTTYYSVFVALLVLLLLTYAQAAYLDLGAFNLVVALLIATTKAALIMLFFMHVVFSDRLTWIAAGAAFLWLGILISLTLSDYLTRGVLENIPGK